MAEQEQGTPKQQDDKSGRSKRGQGDAKRQGGGSQTGTQRDRTDK